jgi:hippurate hydrolase
MVLGQHMVARRAQSPDARAITPARTAQIRLFGRGAHGSMPQASTDLAGQPLQDAAADPSLAWMAAAEAAVVTIGVLQAGTSPRTSQQAECADFDAAGDASWLRSADRHAEAAASVPWQTGIRRWIISSQC